MTDARDNEARLVINQVLSLLRNLLTQSVSALSESAASDESSDGADMAPDAASKLACRIESLATAIKRMRHEPKLVSGSDDGFWVALTDAVKLSDYIWEYTFVEVELTRAGWSVVAGGRTGTCRNTYETGNTATPADLLGVGVDPDHLDTDWFTYDLKNARINRAFKCYEGSDSVGVFYWISEPNGIDGVCE